MQERERERERERPLSRKEEEERKGKENVKGESEYLEGIVFRWSYLFTHLPLNKKVNVLNFLLHKEYLLFKTKRIPFHSFE